MTGNSHPERRLRSLVPADQISLVLYEHDPMNTCCNVNEGMEDEYNSIARDIAKFIRIGWSVESALSQAMHYWFGTPLMRDRHMADVVRDIEAAIEPNKTYKPFLLVHTEVKPTEEYIERIGLFNSEHLIPIPPEIFDQTQTEQDAAIKAMITNNRAATESKLEEFGQIKSYTLYCPQLFAVLYTKNGDLDLAAMQGTCHGRPASE